MLGLPFNGTLASSAIETERRNEMAVAIIQRFPQGVGAAEYDPVADRLNPEDNPPGGLIFHCAGELNGRFEVLDLWQTREDLDRFVEERLIPAQKQVMGEEAWKEMTRAAAEGGPDVAAGLEVIEAPVHKYVAP